jgi:cytochrome c biogenesis protein
MTKLGMVDLRAGESKTFDGVTVRFDGWRPWVSLQVSHDPTQGYLLIAAVAMVAGLFGSLAIRRRRVWVRVSPSGDGSTVVQVGGLARSDSGNFTTEFAALVEKLRGTETSPTLVGVGRE